MKSLTITSGQGNTGYDRNKEIMTGNLWTLINACLFKDQSHWNLIEQVSNVAVYQLSKKYNTFLFMILQLFFKGQKATFKEEG